MYMNPCTQSVHSYMPYTCTHPHTCNYVNVHEPIPCTQSVHSYMPYICTHTYTHTLNAHEPMYTKCTLIHAHMDRAVLGDGGTA